MRKITIKLLLIGIVHISNNTFALQANKCSCCDLINISRCMLAPTTAPHVKIDFDFKKSEVNTNLYAIENCGIPFEISRDEPFIDGTTKEGKLLLVLCRKNKLLDSKEIPLTKNYSSTCKITMNITCE